MKYDILERLKTHLYNNYNENTARKYYSSVVKIFKNLQFSSIDEISREYIESECVKFKTKNEFSGIKNGLLQMKAVYPDLDLPSEEFFKSISIKKKNWSKKPKKCIYLDRTKRKINQIRNPKLRYAYRLALVSALRISELGALEKKDISFEDDGKTIKVNVRHGKGGSNGIVTCLEDSFLYNNLKNYLAPLSDLEKPFYSSVYMREKADALGIECHDLRRACAIVYRNQLKKEMPVFEANQKVKKMLRHSRFSTTKRYLFNKKLIVREGKDGSVRVGKRIKRVSGTVDARNNQRNSENI